MISSFIIICRNIFFGKKESSHFLAYYQLRTNSIKLRTCRGSLFHNQSTVATMGDQFDTSRSPKRSSTVTVPNNDQEEPDIPKKKVPLFGLLEFVTLKILFLDLLVSIGDVGSDFGFSWQLYEKSIEEDDDVLFKYAAIVFSINWFPGIVAAIHVLSMYRNKEGLSPQKLIICALLMLILYPVVPILAYLVLLYCRPKVRIPFSNC